MKNLLCASLALAALCAAGCKSSSADDDDAVNVVDTSELLGQDEAALRAEKLITPENLDAEFAKLAEELGEDR